jgi:cysteine desulfuration protein SufE
VSSLPPRLAEFLETLDLLTDRSERIEMLLDVAERFREVPEAIARRPFPEEHRVPGCESEVYVWTRDRPDGTLDFHFAVENPQGISARALAALLSRGAGGAPLETVAAIPDDLVTRIFGAELSMGKNLGLTGMVGMVRAAAKRRLAGADPD